MVGSRRERGRRLLWVAGTIGVVHAGFSLYWALGGRWLLPTVGQWAVRLADRSPVAAGVALGAVAAVKLTASAVPVLVEAGTLPGRRAWRAAEAGGAALLLVYGLFNVVVAWAVLTGVITSAGGYDHAAEFGHAALWDPLFFLWGAFLAAGLTLTRTTRATAGGETRPVSR